MNPNLLSCEINCIQQNYRQLLLELLQCLNTSNTIEVLDEIDVYRTRHIAAVRLFLETIQKNDRYVFTGVSRLDYQDNEHLPLLLFCDKPVLDDPLSKYVAMSKRLPNEGSLRNFYGQICCTMEDNLRILTDLSESVVVLPFRILNQSNDQQLKDQTFLLDVAKEVFIHLFENIEDIDDYFRKCSNLQSIQRYLKKDAESFLLFTEYDDKSLPFEKRFQNAISHLNNFVDLNSSDAINFYRIVYGSVIQAVDIVFSCEAYRCIPYIRYPVALHYVLWLMQMTYPKELFLELRFKTIVPHITHKCIDKKRLASVPLTKFLEKKRQYCFSQKVHEKLRESGINEQNFNLNQSTVLIVRNELDLFYRFLISD